jgi:hypothetical protein
MNTEINEYTLSVAKHKSGSLIDKPESVNYRVGDI